MINMIKRSSQSIREVLEITKIKSITIPNKKSELFFNKLKKKFVSLTTL